MWTTCCPHAKCHTYSKSVGVLLCVVRWDRAPSDITSYPELEAMVVENKGRLNSYKMGMDAGGEWLAV